MRRAEAGGLGARGQPFPARAGRPAHDASRLVIAYAEVRVAVGVRAVAAVARGVDINIPDVDVVGNDIAEVAAAVAVAVDLMRATENVVGVGVAGSVGAEVQATNAPIIATVMNGVPVAVDGGPDEVIAVAQCGNMTGRPVAIVMPDVAVGVVMVPIAVVAGGVREGVASNPHMPVAGFIIPVPVAVRHVVVDIGRPPVVIVVGINPFAVRIQIGRAHSCGLRTAGHDRAAFVTEYEEACPLAVPRVEVVLDIPIKG